MDKREVSMDNEDNNNSIIKCPSCGGFCIAEEYNNGLHTCKKVAITIVTPDGKR